MSFSNVAVADGGSAAVYKGTLTGEWSGEVKGVYVSGTFSMSISADGVVSGLYYSGFESDTISGTVCASGDFNAKSSSGLMEWSGKINISDGRLSGSGSWKRDGGGGLWNSK